MTIMYKAVGQALGIFGKWARCGISLHEAYSIISKKYCKDFLYLF